MKIFIFSKLIHLACQDSKHIYWKMWALAFLFNLLLLPFTIHILLHPELFTVSPTISQQDDFIHMYVNLFLYAFIPGVIGLFLKALLMTYTLNRTGVSLTQVIVQSLKIFPRFVWTISIGLLIASIAAIPLLVPALIIYIHTYFAGWYVLSGEASGIQALAKSRELFRGRFFRLVLLTIFPVFMTLLANYLVKVYLNYFSVGSAETKIIIETIASATMGSFLVPLYIQYEYHLFTSSNRATTSRVLKSTTMYKIMLGIATTLFGLAILIVIFSQIMASKISF